MKKIAYVYNINDKQNYAAKTMANGFKNAFIEKGDYFRFFDITKLENSFWPDEKLKLVAYAPDIIFAGAEKVPYIPLNLLKNTKVVLWGSFYFSCDYEPRLPVITEKAKQVLNKYSAKHNFLICSPYDHTINECFFSGYQKDLGIKLIRLLHCADKTKYTLPIANPEFDFLWVGSIGQNANAYSSIVPGLKKNFSNYLEYNEHNMISPETIESRQYYSRSCITPNIHTEAQIKNKMLLNEKVFTSSMLGGFQICDNPLARELFKEDELIIATNGEEFLEKALHFAANPDGRIEMIRKIQETILRNHTYSNRIDQILEAYS